MSPLHLCSHRADPMVHLHTRRLIRVPGVLVSTSFLSRRSAGVVFYCDLVACHYNLFIPPNFRQRTSVEIIFVPPFQNSTALFLRGLLEHVVCFVVDLLPHGRPTSCSTGRILYNDNRSLTRRRINLYSTVDFFPTAAGMCRKCSIRCQYPNIKNSLGIAF